LQELVTAIAWLWRDRSRAHTPLHSISARHCERFAEFRNHTHRSRPSAAGWPVLDWPATDPTGLAGCRFSPL